MTLPDRIERVSAHSVEAELRRFIESRSSEGDLDVLAAMYSAFVSSAVVVVSDERDNESAAHRDGTKLDGTALRIA